MSRNDTEQAPTWHPNYLPRPSRIMKLLRFLNSLSCWWRGCDLAIIDSSDIRHTWECRRCGWRASTWRK